MNAGLPSEHPRSGGDYSGSTTFHRTGYIVEEPGGIRYLTECEVPTEEYNTARMKDLRERYPKASPGVMEHLEALERFLDTSILAGFITE